MNEKLKASVLQYFDPQKYRILLHFCKSETNEVRARAWTAAVWAYMRFTPRFAQYPDLKDGLSLLSQDERLKEELALLQRQLLLSLEAAKAEKKLQNEIFPDLLKNRNYQRNKIGLEQMEEDLAKALRGEPNAEWEQMQGNRHLADNMKKIIAMGQEGIDINLGTFSGLKGFSFFQSLPHWFAPFNPARPEIRAVLPEGLAGHPIGMLMDAGNFCDSDKYSLCLMLSQIPASQREMMVAQIGAQMGGNEEHLKEAAKGSTDITSVYRNYLQDLYRFYKLHPRKAQFDDPFRIQEIMESVDSLATNNTAAKASVDIALHDLTGRIMGQPWWKIWGFSPENTPCTSFTIGYDADDDVVREKTREASWAKVLKVKLGMGNDRDRRMINLIRETAPDIPVYVDANQGWKDRSETLEMIEWLAGKGVVMVEQPLSKYDLDSHAWLTERSPLPIIADESCQRLTDIPRLKGAFHGINIKLMKCTGMREAREMVTLAKALGMRLMIGCMTETSVAISAAAQLSPEMEWADLDGNILLANDCFSGMKLTDGKITLSDAPGIGVSLI